MFSFFSKKKPTPLDEISPSDDWTAIPGANSSNGDDFTFIQRAPAPAPPFPPQNNLYPMMSPGYAPQIPNQPQPYLQRQSTLGPASYLSDVPFILSDTISVDNSFEAQQSQIDGILAILTRSLNISNSFEYDFAVERNIVDQ